MAKKLRASRTQPEFRGCVLATDGKDVRRVVEVVIRNGEVFTFQPRKELTRKSSYHKSGEFHVRLDPGSKAPFAWQKAPPTGLVTEENVFTISLDNFDRLLPANRNQCNETYLIDLAGLPAGLQVVQIAIGQFFRPKPNVRLDGYQETACRQFVFQGSTPKICVRVFVLSG